MCFAVRPFNFLIWTDKKMIGDEEVAILNSKYIWNIVDAA
jgi:hypothetical protein